MAANYCIKREEKRLLSRSQLSPEGGQLRKEATLDGSGLQITDMRKFDVCSFYPTTNNGKRQKQAATKINAAVNANKETETNKVVFYRIYLSSSSSSRFDLGEKKLLLRFGRLHASLRAIMSDENSQQRTSKKLSI